ncbi:hypothetical protein L3N51_02079 [Metallosphaera sp. J1]|uniref:hypothetical protein n=1 Tax=Metallosphaera TaxID=41980 RepID=UPI001EDD1436|nr:hypothetical protein [Metallosphaera javensis (ex Hofmann et al. 2022)]MCG3109783.1 hypothetical protein [Metallosphaera javensis (ex Hofmann et al. 2022)]BCS92671.1 MAG: hypothetical protein MjAS7_1279 [Metallosphaera javensis (ex Sakai et al. 2022)]
MKPLYIGLIALALLGSGVAASSVAGFGPIAYITYHIISNQGNENITIIPANINLGNLTPGMKGNVTTNATITLTKSDNYTVMLLHVEKLKKDFSRFVVEITIDNQTFNVSEHHPYHVIQLQNGTYQVVIKIFYTVSMNPKGDLNVSNEPLLIIHPGIMKDHGDHDHGDHGNGNQNSQGRNDNQDNDQNDS